MATLWDVITGNSSLPVQAGNTFWDHMQNQNSGTGAGPITVNQIENFSIELEDDSIDVILQDTDISIILDEEDI